MDIKVCLSNNNSDKAHAGLILEDEVVNHIDNHSKQDLKFKSSLFKNRNYKNDHLNKDIDESAKKSLNNYICENDKQNDIEDKLEVKQYAFNNSLKNKDNDFKDK